MDRQSWGPQARLFTMLAVMAVVVTVMPGDAHADPFATAITKACDIQRTFKQFASAVGAIGITACMLLGYFNKLNWKWLATGIGVSFSLPLVNGIIQMVGGTTPC
jgi:type IV secretory pathway VirB2 component (pilin)